MVREVGGDVVQSAVSNESFQCAHKACKRLVRLSSGPPASYGSPPSAIYSNGGGYPSNRNGTGLSMYRCGRSNSNIRALPDKSPWSMSLGSESAKTRMSLWFIIGSNRKSGMQQIGNEFNIIVNSRRRSTKEGDITATQNASQVRHTCKHPWHAIDVQCFDGVSACRRGSGGGGEDVVGIPEVAALPESPPCRHRRCGAET